MIYLVFLYFLVGILTLVAARNFVSSARDRLETLLFVSFCLFFWPVLYGFRFACELANGDL